MCFPRSNQMIKMSTLVEKEDESNLFQNLIFNSNFKFFSSEVGHKLFRSILRQSVEKDDLEIAEMIFKKFEEKKVEICNEPYFEIAVQRFFKISFRLKNKNINGNTNKSARFIKDQTIKDLKNKKVYSEFLSACLKDKSTKDNSSLDKEVNVPDCSIGEFECPVCFFDMFKPLKIFCCHNGHFICDKCLSNDSIKSCPICRDDFSLRPPKRSFEAEEKASKSNCN